LGTSTAFQKSTYGLFGSIACAVLMSNSCFWGYSSSSTSRRQRCSFDADRFAKALTDNLQCDADHG